MAKIQHEDARRALEFISQAVKQRKCLTYQDVAQRLGRTPPPNHARAVAQMCDLLDAAAALADVPLVALFWVRPSPDKINPKAWKENSERRARIIERSRKHSFTKSDFRAIIKALNELDGRGNRKAWKYVRDKLTREEVNRRVAGPYESGIPSAILKPDPDAIDDLGTDAADRARAVVWSYARNPKVRTAVIKRANGRCENCGALGFLKSDSTHYLETHHIISLAKDGKDRVSNVIALCPNDHREAHFGQRAEELEKEMIKKIAATRG